MATIAAIAGTYEGLKGALGIIQSLNATNTQVQINDAKIALQQIILDAQMALASANEAQSASAERITELEQAIVRLTAWGGEKERYELKRYSPGALAYTLKPSMAEGEPPHHLCANCYQQGKKAILQTTGELRMRYRVHRCPSCKNETVIGAEMPSAEPAASTDPGMVISDEALRSLR